MDDDQMTLESIARDGKAMEDDRMSQKCQECQGPNLGCNMNIEKVRCVEK